MLGVNNHDYIKTTRFYVKELLVFPLKLLETHYMSNTMAICANDAGDAQRRQRDRNISSSSKS